MAGRANCVAAGTSAINPEDCNEHNNRPCSVKPGKCFSVEKEIGRQVAQRKGVAKAYNKLEIIECGFPQKE